MVLVHSQNSRHTPASRPSGTSKNVDLLSTHPNHSNTMTESLETMLVSIPQDSNDLISFGFEVKLLASVIVKPTNPSLPQTISYIDSSVGRNRHDSPAVLQIPAASPADNDAPTRPIPAARQNDSATIESEASNIPRPIYLPGPCFLNGYHSVGSQATQAPKRTSFFNRGRPNAGHNVLSGDPVPHVMETSIHEKVHSIIAQTISEVHEQVAASMSDLKRSGVLDTEFWKTGWIVKKANSPEVDPREQEKFVCRYPGITWVPIEITSPVFRYVNGKQVWPSVLAVMSQLTRKHLVISNYTCDVHVHLGRHDNRAFCLPTLKRLAVILWLTEDALRSVRNPLSPNFENLYTWGSALTRYSRAARNLPLPHDPVDADGNIIPDFSMDPTSPVCAAMPTHELDTRRILKMSTIYSDPETTKCLRRILSCKSHRELGLLLSGPEKQYRRLGMNFSAFGMEDDRARKNPRTVEIRILEGTLAGIAIVEWLKMVSGLVQIAVDEDGQDSSRFIDFAVEIMKGTAMGNQPQAMLRDIKMHLGVM